MLFASPDVGGVKRARSLRQFLGKTWSFVIKREKANQVSAITVIGDVNGADVIMVDDLVDTAGTR